MSEGFFASLPLEITIDILSRLPCKAIIRCKCVCKPWLELLDSHRFVKSHLSKSDPGIAVLSLDEDSCSTYEIFEFENGKDPDHNNLLINPITKFYFPHGAVIKGSANGLLCLLEYGKLSKGLFVCNPITREYVEVHCPSPREMSCSYPKVATFPEFNHDFFSSINYGFGASRITGQHKVVQIFSGSISVHEGQSVLGFGCHVHTLGTGSWRRVDCGAWFSYGADTFGVLVNGNLHWIVSDSYSKMWISCFDLETEQFSSFSLPPFHEVSDDHSMGLSALDGCLCLCDNSGGLISEVGIWLMKDYGVEKSWSKEYVIHKSKYMEHIDSEFIYPLKCFQDGDILMLLSDYQLFYYSKETETSQGVGSEVAGDVNSIIFTPSFLSLKNLGLENVISF